MRSLEILTYFPCFLVSMFTMCTIFKFTHDLARYIKVGSF